MRKTKIAIEDVLKWLAFRRRVNRQPLESITFTRKGQPISVSPEAVEDFRFTGLSNIDFIAMGDYKRRPKAALEKGAKL